MAEDSPVLLRGPFLSSSLLFLVLFLVSSVDNNKASYRRFLRRHIDPRRVLINPSYYCQHIMRARGLTSPTCMGKNIFIHARYRRIKIICGEGGRPFNNSASSDSIYSYTITTCHSTGGSPPNHCKYRGRSERRRIRVACFKGVPVDLIRILHSASP
ncbi:ribonuclease-like [Eublepharis macularius]|uniref:Ribonuclease-like n=1 Tax=Eublepharis macularius TaxID=481883 RepID=A0AA97LCB6_EUBMA|nr:ribonuclease-like [Eublepharis macularius]